MARSGVFAFESGTLGGALVSGALPPVGQIVWLPRLHGTSGFTARDRSDLLRWSSKPQRAVTFDDDPAAFAMLYQGAAPWASWAVAREGGWLKVWNCVTFADLGRFSSMAEALEAISGDAAADEPECCTVLPFAAARLRRTPDARAQ